MDHYKTSHGRGQNGTEDDLILLTDVMKEIDAYEVQNNLQLGPPLMSTLEHGGVTKKFSSNKDINLEDNKGTLKTIKILDNIYANFFNANFKLHSI